MTPILFYDGHCGLCNSTVRWCLAHDRARVLRFAPLQGVTYAALRIPDKPTGLDTVVLWDEAGLHRSSDAVLRTLGHLGRGWVLVGRLGRLIPRPLREAGYRTVARHRRGWFGRPESLGVPKALDGSRLLP